MAASSLHDFLGPMSFQDPPTITQSGWLEHAPFAAWLIEATEPRLVVELGTHWGYSFFAFCEAVKKLGLKTQLVAIDPWEGDEHAGYYSDEVFNYVETLANDNYPDMAKLMRMRFDEALQNFADGSIDVLHIDGRHRYEDARQDFDTYLPKMSPRGVIIMHDIVVRENGFGVWQHWEEVQQKFPTFEFRHGNGLGIVAVGGTVPVAIAGLTSLDKDSSVADQVRQAYHHLGRSIARSYEIRQLVEQEELQRTLELDRRVRGTAAIVRQAEGRERALLLKLRSLERKVSQLNSPALAAQDPHSTVGLTSDRSSSFDNVGEPTRRLLFDLFDPQFYRQQHPELASDQADFDHYLAHGWPIGESPTPLFDPDWYLAMNPDVAAAGVGALAHYLQHGDAEGRLPNAIFDPSWYREAYGHLFSTVDLALTHFTRLGRVHRHDPSPVFRTQWYLEQNPEVADSGRLALSDYLTEGALRLREPHPAFDTVWYLSTYEESCSDGANPLVDYLTHGRSEGRVTNEVGSIL